MAEEQGASRSWEAAVTHVTPDAGSLVEGRLRFLKRLFVRLQVPSLRSQAIYNQAVLESLVEIRNQLAGSIAEHRESAVQQLRTELEAALGSVRQQVRDEVRPELLWEKLDYQGYAVEAILPVLETHGYAADGLKEAIESLKVTIEENTIDRELISDEIELARQQAFARFHDGLGMMQSQLDDLTRHAEELSERAIEHADGLVRQSDEVVRNTRTELSELALRLRDTEVHLVRAVSESRTRLAQVDLLLDRVRRALPREEPEVLLPAPSRFDSLYGAFEDVLRGSEEVLQSRLSTYLDDFEAVGGLGPVLDVGCGRGDLLLMLAGRDIEAYGVEINPGYGDFWQQHGLDVRLVDVVEHLRQVPEGSLGAISAVQVVEHLTVEQMLEFFDLSLRALAAGGLLLLETPNPENLLVGASSFYLDPTHDRPLPPPLLAFLVESRGYAKVEVRYLAREELQGLPQVKDSEWAEDLRPVRDAVERFLFAPQDYAVLARRI